MDNANENDVSCFRRGIYFSLLFFSVKVFENTVKYVLHGTSQLSGRRFGKTALRCYYAAKKR